MHPVSQGNLLRGGVGVPNDGANLICPKGFKGILPARLRRFGGIAAVPVGAVEEVPDFQKLLTFPRLHGQAALTNHFAGLFEDDRPKTKAELTVSLQLAVQPYLRFAVTEGTLVGVHRLFVLKDAAQGRKILLSHLPQEQAFGLQNHGKTSVSSKSSG